MPSKDYLADSQSETNFETLLKITRRRKSIAFVGAGFSMSEGYRTWRNGIMGTHDVHNNLVQEGLVHRTGLPKNEIDACKDDLLLIVEKCKNHNVTSYLDFLQAEFGRKTPAPAANSHRTLWETAFVHVVTTNFDPCLYDVSTGHCDAVITYPKKFELLSQRALYHIHGRAYQTKGDPEPIEFYLNNLVFPSSEFEVAYDKSNEIKTLIYRLIVDYCLVFVGFSLEDAYFKKALLTLAEARNPLFKKNALSHSSSQASPPPQFIFVKVPQEDEYGDPVTFKNAQVLYEEKRKQFEDYGLSVIGFYAIDTAYTGLSRALKDLRNDAPNDDLPKEYESKLFALADMTS